MSSEQYSETPLPDWKCCPQCGDVMPSSAQTCPRCAEKHGIQEGMPKLPCDKETLPPIRPIASGDNAGWAFSGVLAILIIIGLGLVVPGILFVLLVLATPALIRTLTAAARPKDETAVAIPPSLPVIFLSSIGVAAIVGVAAQGAFFAVCWVAGFSAFAVTESFDSAVYCGVSAGAIPGLVVAVWLLRRLWSRKG